MPIGKQEVTVPYFNLWSKDDEAADSYWVLASTNDEARLLVALNVTEAADAQNSDRFECVINDDKKPPSGFIYRRLYGPVSITRRSSHA
jgi:hypothetical protein